MSKKIYVFELVNEEGRPFKKLSRRCTNLGAQSRTIRLLRKTPKAAAAFGYEAGGSAVLSAYRD
ncbi:hypothetical protein PUV54_10140 [Hyphococcus flavus]|uniref:Uncharacterized protein n=1 Tax=Hyphococcus flavus TaxID=1866326 RepID=A0AAE9ZD66_9PROT|nr:hypothetical protein [Hyphococcus flavus]WDI30317.1 hypothetical protein PUV54_10140 [Hyphococcus flavus]